MDGYQRRKQQKKDRIRQAALELFTTHGTRRVSIAEIAAKAGANPVTVYNHFGDKDTLVRDVIQHLIETHWVKSREILNGDLPFLEKLEQLVISKTEMSQLQNSEFLFTAVAEDPGIREMIESLYEQEINPLFARFIRDGQEQGLVRADLSGEGIALYIEMFTALARSHPGLFSDHDRLVHFTHEIWSLFLYGLIGRQSDSSAPPIVPTH